MKPTTHIRSRAAFAMLLIPLFCALLFQSVSAQLIPPTWANGIDTWTNRNAGVTGDFRGLGYANGLYVVTGTQGELLISPDAINWTRRDSGDSTWLSDVAYGNNTFVIVGQNGKVLTSADGLSWLNRPSGTAANFSQVSFLNGQFFAVGDRGTIASSFDGSDWVFRDSGIADTNSSTGILYRMVYGNGIYVIGGQSSTILTSVDTTHWTSLDLGRPSPSIVFGNGIFVLNGLQGANYCAPQTSADGVTWTIQAGINTRAISPVAFAQGTFLGFSGDGSHGIAQSMWSSADGTNWVNRPCPTSNGIWNIKYLNYTFMAVGENGTIIQTAPYSTPFVILQPVNELVQQGAGTNFIVAAVGSVPLLYQWRFSPTNFAAQMDLPGQTNALLTLTNVAAGSAGAYSVRISNNLGSIVSSNAILFVQGAPDTDGDGIADFWETLYGLDPGNSADATKHAFAGGQTNKLTYLQAYVFGLDPTAMDSDGDGVSDFDEIFSYGTNPLKADTDGDGIPDGWEIAHHLNPLLNDSAQIGPAGVSNWQIYQYDINPAHTIKLEPRNPFDPTNPLLAPGRSVYEVLNGGVHTNNNYYDHNDRLVGVEYSRGISIAYTYDGNDNLVRQTVMSRVSETNGISLLWQFLHGLTNGTAADGPFGDSDGDGWSNYQEWLSGSDPTNSASMPVVLNNPGTNIGSLKLPFPPSNWVMATGNLDGLPGDEIIVGADGNPGTNDNTLFILSQTVTNWLKKQLSVGSLGITSMAIGSTSNRPGSAIYIGLRQPGGFGAVWELSQTSGLWHTNVVAVSTNEAAFVIGVRAADVLVSVATNGVDGGLWSMSFTEGWRPRMVSTNTSHKASTMAQLPARQIIRSTAVRRLDHGGMEIFDCGLDLITNKLLIPPNAHYRFQNDQWYFASIANGTSPEAEQYCRQFGGNLAAINSADENLWIQSLFPGYYYIGLYFDDILQSGFASMVNGTVDWGWADGSTSMYRNWSPGQPHFWGIWYTDPIIAGKDNNGQWFMTDRAFRGGGPIPGIGELKGWDWLSFLDETEVFNPIEWAGSQLRSGLLSDGSTNSVSVFEAFVDDKNFSGHIDQGDVFIILEHDFQTNSSSTHALGRVPIVDSKAASTFAIALANLVLDQPDCLFSAEPSGQLFVWNGSGSNGVVRSLFSDAYSGYSWQALSAVKMPSVGEGLVGLLIGATDQNSCQVKFWSPHPVLPTFPANSVETAPSVIVLPSTNPLAAMAMVPLRLWDAEGNASTPFLQYQLPGTPTWNNATITRLDNLPFNLSNQVSALPTGINHTVTWDTSGDLGSVRTNVLLRASAQDFLLRGDWSLPVPYVIDTRPPIRFNTGTNDFHQTKSGFQFSLSGGDGSSPLVIYASTNLFDWKPIFTNPPFLGTTQYLDPAAILYPSRFYRAQEQ